MQPVEQNILLIFANILDIICIGNMIMHLTSDINAAKLKPFLKGNESVFIPNKDN